MRSIRVVLLTAALACTTAAFAAAQVANQEPAKAAATPAPPATPLSEVEQRWGIRILGVRLSAAGYMMDFRYYVSDPAKAAPLFIRGLQPTLRDEASGSTFIVPAPPKLGPMRSSNPPQLGRTYFMFFANPAQFVKAGNAVTITVGEFRIEHVKVMAENEPFPEMPRFDAKSVVVEHPPAPAAGAAAAAGEQGSDTDVAMGRARPAKITVPDLTLTDQNGAQVKLTDLAAGGAPVILTFMYTSCTTNCPALAATLAQVQRDLGAGGEKVRFVSVSIDPDQDTPARMREFLAKHGAKPGWLFLTGTLQQSEAIQRAFDIYRGNRKSHPPAYFIRDAKSGNWWRIGGLPAAEIVVGEFRRLAGQSK
jgi:protein SCO1/2